MKHSVERRRGAVIDFVTTSESYTIHIEPDLRLDVARVQSKQADDSSDSYMWIQAVQGFFVLYQDLSGPKPGPWLLIFEVSPQSFSSSFFPYIEDEFFRLLQEWQALQPLEEVEGRPPDNIPDGE